MNRPNQPNRGTARGAFPPSRGALCPYNAPPITTNARPVPSNALQPFAPGPTRATVAPRSLLSGPGPLSVESWGLLVPGRSPIPSEGFAMTYRRVGPAQQQAVRAFDNGTSLQFGPNVSALDTFHVNIAN